MAPHPNHQPPNDGRLKQETVSPEPREPEFMHHNIGGRDFVLDARYVELKCVFDEFLLLNRKA